MSGKSRRSGLSFLLLSMRETALLPSAGSAGVGTAATQVKPCETTITQSHFISKIAVLYVSI